MCVCVCGLSLCFVFTGHGSESWRQDQFISKEVCVLSGSKLVELVELMTVNLLDIVINYIT